MASWRGTSHLNHILSFSLSLYSSSIHKQCLFRQVRGGGDYGVKADVYSLGGILHLLLLGKDPPSTGPRFDRNTGLLISAGTAGLHSSARWLMSKMMQRDEQDRIDCKAVIEDHFTQWGKRPTQWQ